jgi:hypothetical protein
MSLTLDPFRLLLISLVCDPQMIRLAAFVSSFQAANLSGPYS